MPGLGTYGRLISTQKRDRSDAISLTKNAQAMNSTADKDEAVGDKVSSRALEFNKTKVLLNSRLIILHSCVVVFYISIGGVLMKDLINDLLKLNELFKLKKIAVYLMFSCCVVALIIYFVYTMEYGNYTAVELEELLVKSPDVSYKLYYYIQHSGLYVLLYIFLIFIIPNLYTINFINQKNNHFINFQITRLGYLSNMKTEMIFVIYTTFIYVLFVNVFIYLIIHLLYFRFKSSLFDASVYDMTRIICSNQILNLVIYMLLSAMGYGLFAAVIYNMQIFIKNSYVFRGLGLILGILLYTIPAMIANSIPVYFLRLIVGSLYLPYILNPGIVYMPAIESKPLLLFLFGILAYSIICLFLMKLRLIKEYKNE